MLLSLNFCLSLIFIVLSFVTGATLPELLGRAPITQRNPNNTENINSQSLSNPGLKPRDLSYKILGGEHATIDDFPFTVSISISVNSAILQCTGSLIAPNIVITAAHCMVNSSSAAYSPENITVGAGSEYNLGNNTNTFKTIRSLPHPKFNIMTAENDIALIVLSADIPSNIAVPTRIYGMEISNDLKVETAGWGFTSNNAGSGLSPILNYVSALISTEKECAENSSFWKGNNNSTVCTTNDVGKGGCYGDSGGPLVASDIPKKPLLGITSKTIVPGNKTDSRCGIESQIVYYTNPAYYIGWIMNETNLPFTQVMYTTRSNTKSSNANRRSNLFLLNSTISHIIALIILTSCATL